MRYCALASGSGDLGGAWPLSDSSTASGRAGTGAGWGGATKTDQQ